MCAFGLHLVIMMVTGYELQDMWVDPLVKSTSASDFWSKRWNLSVHTTLKRGIYLPVRQGLGANKYVGLVATFLASGLIHEWLVWLVFSPLQPMSSADSSCDTAHSSSTGDDASTTTTTTCYAYQYQPTYGPALVFFLFQALLIALEFGVGTVCKTATATTPAATNANTNTAATTTILPSAVKTVLTIGIGGSMAHWFSEAYIHSNFFLDAQVAYFLVKRI